MEYVVREERCLYTRRCTWDGRVFGVKGHMAGGDRDGETLSSKSTTCCPPDMEDSPVVKQDTNRGNSMKQSTRT